MASREQILETAFSKFAMCGINGASMDEIASALRISKKTLYENFPSKDELAVASVEKAAAVHCERIRKLLNFMPNPLTALVFSIIEHMKFGHRLSEKFVKEVMSHKVLGAKIVELGADLKARSEKIVEDGIEQGFIVRNSDLDKVLEIVRDKGGSSGELKNSGTFSCRKGFNIVTTLLQGICTPAGQQVLAELRENYS